MRILVSFLISILPLAAEAQVQQGKLITGRSCSYFGEMLPANVAMFTSNKEAEDTIKKIVAAYGLTPNFKIVAGGVPNAAAVISDNQRYVVYNPTFIENIHRDVPNKWAATSILAHEIGHHLNGHTLLEGGSRPQLELEADYFSGFVLQRLGATLDDAEAAMNKLAPADATPTHPARHDRLAAIGAGWSKACDSDGSCRSAAPKETASIREQRRKESVSGGERTAAHEEGKDSKLSFSSPKPGAGDKKGRDQAEEQRSIFGEWSLPKSGEVLTIEKNGVWFHPKYGRAKVREATDDADIKVFYESEAVRCSYRVSYSDGGKTLILSATDATQDPEYCPTGDLKSVNR